MFENAIEILTILEKNNFKAYIVGGYIRNYLLNKDSNDIDICTNATPDKIIKLFDTVEYYYKYGAVKVKYKGFCYDITTFRRDIYIFNKLFIIFKKDIKYDVLRRDFTINSLYMDRNKNIIYPYNYLNDINDRILRCCYNSDRKIKEDPLRILRAIRYCGILNLKMDKNLKNSILNYKELLNKVPRVKVFNELNKILSYKNYYKCLNFIKTNNMCNIIGISFNDVKWCSKLSGMWAQIKGFDDLFSNNVIKDINNIRMLLDKGIVDEYDIYLYGLDVCSVAYEILDIDKNVLLEKSKKIIINSKKDIKISYMDICNYLNTKPCNKIKKIYNDIEKNIIYGKIKNNKKSIESYLERNENINE